MLTYNMDVEERSTWLRATPGAAAHTLLIGTSKSEAKRS